jgi:hypothetical protein
LTNATRDAIATAIGTIFQRRFFNNRGIEV